MQLARASDSVLRVNRLSVSVGLPVYMRSVFLSDVPFFSVYLFFFYRFETVLRMHHESIRVPRSFAWNALESFQAAFIYTHFPLPRALPLQLTAPKANT